MSKDLHKFMSQQPTTYRQESWYIASPYSHPDPKVMAKRREDAQRVEDTINATYGHATAYSPIAQTVSMRNQGSVPKEGWYLKDFSDLVNKDMLIVLMLEGWETSIGVALEISFALGKGIPINYWTLAEALSDELPF